MVVHGFRDAVGRLHVTVDGVPLTPDASLKVFDHSPNGFECGYAGSGPAQLALAILLNTTLSERRAVRLHQLFKADYVEHWYAPFTVTVDLEAFIDKYDPTCRNFDPDHNGECLNCDEWIDQHDLTDEAVDNFLATYVDDDPDRTDRIRQLFEAKRRRRTTDDEP